jgi:uncharacterized membrane protein
MKILLLLGVGVLIVEALLFWGYSAVKAFGRGDATMVALLLAGFFVSLSICGREGRMPRMPHRPDGGGVRA